jgi:uncharacterized protein YebE (UPF0316 family)
MLEYLLIVLVKTFEVSLGTLRIKLITRGQRVTGAMVAFVEIIIWLLVVGRVLSDMDDPGKILAYALGYATGNFMGVLVEEWIGLGSTKVEVVISRKTAADVVHQIRELGFGVTVIDAGNRSVSGTLRRTGADCRRCSCARSCKKTAYVSKHRRRHHYLYASCPICFPVTAGRRFFYFNRF